MKPMSGVLAPLGVCVVVHDPRYCAALAKRIAGLQTALGERFDCMVLVAASSVLDVAVVRAAFEGLRLRVLDCRRVDDLYFDFSAYVEGARHFARSPYRGILFVNDTLIPKHDSAHLLKALASRLEMLRPEAFDFPILVGPYRKSEFSFADGGLDEFVATFLFFLNRPGVALLTDLLDVMPAIHRALERGDGPAVEQHAGLLRLSRAHALQVRERYRVEGEVGSRLHHKLTTVCCERLLTQRVRAAGLVWFLGLGMMGRLLVPAQAALSRLLGRLGR